MIFNRRLLGLCYTYRSLLYFFTIFLIISTHYILKLRIFCINSHARDYARDVCQTFQSGSSTGNLCSPLCIAHEIHTVSCYSYRSTKKVKFRAKWRDTEIVFKAPKQTTPFHWFENGKITYPSEKQFLMTVKSLIANKLNVNIPLNSIMKITRGKFSSDTSRQKEIDDISSLVQENEFLIQSIFPENSVFPKLLGTCGFYYAIEYLEPVQVKTSIAVLAESVQEWMQRLQISAQIMELAKKFDTEFHEPFHLCDMELHHFGSSTDDESLRYLNLNHVYPKSAINKVFRGMSCETDDDCDFYDCRSKCNYVTKTCAYGVTNSNYQIICEKVFLGWRRFNTVIIPGLLMTQHTPSDLAAVLRQCANPGNDQAKPRLGPDEGITKRLYEIILEVEQTVLNQISEV